MKPRIVNIINFVRGCEPRRYVDLFEPVFHQVRLGKEFGLPTTFLLQYDALIQERFSGFLKEELSENDEVGGWWEIMQPLVEKAGMKWRGRYPWDWFTDVGFSCAYTPAEREKLVDVYMEEFKQIFGKLPRSVGSWFMDAHTLGYMSDRYGVIGSCCCKDQLGTDGYTLWGGYWNQAYYPSRVNAMMPGQTEKGQIPIPIFRMLGSDPIYQYECNLGPDDEAAPSFDQGVVSLEPVYTEGGGNPPWVRWFFDSMVNQPCVSFSYAQVGQENAFGWPEMKVGLTDQMEYLASLKREGLVRIETLETSAKWFRESFPVTPPSAVTALTDAKWNGNKSALWYDTRFYRASLLWDGPDFLIRDIHLFDERYAERYLTEPCTTPRARYDTLPVLDGFSWSASDHRAGVRIVDANSAPINGEKPTVTEPGDGALKVVWPTDLGAVEILFEEGKITFDLPNEICALEFSWSPKKSSALKSVEPNVMHFIHEGFEYFVHCSTGCCQMGDNMIKINPNQKRVVLNFTGT